ncbi:phage major capsid protein [Microbacterium sp. HJ5]
MNLHQQLKALQDRGHALYESVKAAGRDFTDADLKALEQTANEVRALKAKIERAEKQAAFANDLFAMPAGHVEGVNGEPTRVKSWGAKVGENLKALAVTAPGGQKALVSGSVGVPAILSTVLTEAQPRTILDLIPVLEPTRRGTGVPSADDNLVDFVGRGGRDGNMFSYQRQIARVNNAGAVPDLAEKPTSTYAFDDVNDTFRVYANRTEYLPWRYLSDYEGLIAILQSQLMEDTLVVMERDVISGDGEGDRFRGLLNTSGIQSQAYTTDLVTTLRAAKWKLLAQSRGLTGWALNPLDLQAIEALRENGATGAFLFKGREDIEHFLGAPVVTSLGLPVGTAVAADWTQAEVAPMGDDQLVFDGHKQTENNTFRFMFEGRYGFRVKNPFDFVKVDLTA